MIFHFHTKNVTFFPEDQSYFEETLGHLKKLLTREENHPDAVDVKINVEKNKHHSGDVFEASAHLNCPHNGSFHAEVSTENIKKCADELYAKLQPQVKKFHDNK